MIIMSSSELESHFSGGQEAQSWKAHFLSLLTAFDNHSISSRYFEIYAEVEWFRDWVELFRCSGMWDSTAFLAVLEEFAQCSYTSHRSDNHEGWLISVHPKAYDAIPQDLFEQQRSFTTEALGILEIYLSRVNEHKLPLGARRETLRHLDTCLQQSPDCQLYTAPLGLIDSPDGAFWFASKYESHCRFEEAAWLFEAAVAQSKEWNGNAAPKTIYAMDKLAHVYMSLGLLTKAETLFREVWSFKLSEYGSGHPDTLGTVENLSVCCHKQGRRSESGELHKLVLNKVLEFHDVRPRSASCEHFLQNPAQTLTDNTILFDLDNEFSIHFNCQVHDHNRATFLADEGKYDEAERIFQTVLKRRTSDIGDTHPLTLSTRKNIGMLLICQNRYSEAHRVLNDVLEDAAEVLGEDSTLALCALDSLAVCYSLSGELNESVAISRVAFDRTRRLLGTKNPLTLEVQHNLAFNLQQFGDMLEAEAVYRKVLVLRESSLGVGHPETSRTVKQLIEILRKSDRGDEAQQLASDYGIENTKADLSDKPTS